MKSINLPAGCRVEFSLFIVVPSAGREVRLQIGPLPKLLADTAALQERVVDRAVAHINRMYGVTDARPMTDEEIDDYFRRELEGGE